MSTSLYVIACLPQDTPFMREKYSHHAPFRTLVAEELLDESGWPLKGTHDLPGICPECEGGIWIGPVGAQHEDQGHRVRHVCLACAVLIQIVTGAKVQLSDEDEEAEADGD